MRKARPGPRLGRLLDLASTFHTEFCTAQIGGNVGVLAYIVLTVAVFAMLGLLQKLAERL